MGMPTPEEKVAENLERLRTEAGLTYDGLAQKLLGMGIRIHPSAIQKTEKSGRKATIKEMVAYARVFKIPVQRLWGDYAPGEEVIAAQRDLTSAERVLKIGKLVRSEYEQIIRGVAEQAVDHPSIAHDLEIQVTGAVAKIVLLGRKERGEEPGVLYTEGWEHAQSLISDEKELPVELETALDCLKLIRAMKAKASEQRIMGATSGGLSIGE
jgi:transcriptional regulator with XRE-family HTH domain